MEATLKIKVPVGLVTELAQLREKVAVYETHRGFKALAFYLLLRSLTTSSGIYRQLNEKYHTKGSADGFETWSTFNKRLARQIGSTFNSVASAARRAEKFGLIKITDKGYQFVSVQSICSQYALLYHGQQQLQFRTIDINPKTDNLERMLKALVIAENFDRQRHALSKKIERIPGVQQSLANYIPNWKKLSLKQLCDQVVMWQKRLFETYSNGTEGYDLLHSIHADIAVSCKRLNDQFAYKSRQSVMYLKATLKQLGMISVTKREVIGKATRSPHEPDGSVKPIKMVYLKAQNLRKWCMPDAITINFKTA